MKTLESVKNDVFASFADAQMSKEEMKMVKGGGSWTCHYFKAGTNEFVTSTGYSSDANAIANCSGDVQRNGTYCGGCEPTAESELK